MLGVKPRDTLKRPYLSAQTVEMGGVLQSAIKSATVRHRKRFLEKSELVVDVQLDWKEFARSVLDDAHLTTRF